MDKNMSGWILIIIGIGILVSIIFPFSAVIYFWINLTSGVLVTFISFSSVDNSYGVTWLSGAAGYWLFWSAFISGLLTGSGMAVNYIILGIVILSAGLFERRKNTKSAPAIEDIYKQKPGWVS